MPSVAIEGASAGPSLDVELRAEVPDQNLSGEDGAFEHIQAADGTREPCFVRTPPSAWQALQMHEVHAENSKVGFE
jgi:hypothetical protein